MLALLLLMYYGIVPINLFEGYSLYSIVSKFDHKHAAPSLGWTIIETPSIHICRCRIDCTMYAARYVDLIVCVG